MSVISLHEPLDSQSNDGWISMEAQTCWQTKSSFGSQFAQAEQAPQIDRRFSSVSIRGAVTVVFTVEFRSSRCPPDQGMKPIEHFNQTLQEQRERMSRAEMGQLMPDDRTQLIVWEIYRALRQDNNRLLHLPAERGIDTRTDE